MSVGTLAENKAIRSEKLRRSFMTAQKLVKIRMAFVEAVKIHVTTSVIVVKQ